MMNMAPIATVHVLSNSIADHNQRGASLLGLDDLCLLWIHMQPCPWVKPSILHSSDIFGHSEVASSLLPY